MKIYTRQQLSILKTITLFLVQDITVYNSTIVEKSKAMLVLSFDDIFQSFIDPERPTEEEFVMFRLQHGVDWIVEPMK